jgi:hypothetical protein
MLDKPAGFLPASVQLIHEGALDNFLVLAALKHVGYSGKIGLQGYSIGGDACGKLKESIEVGGWTEGSRLRAFRSMSAAGRKEAASASAAGRKEAASAVRRLDEHPEWGMFNPA